MCCCIWVFVCMELNWDDRPKCWMHQNECNEFKIHLIFGTFESFGRKVFATKWCDIKKGFLFSFLFFLLYRTRSVCNLLYYHTGYESTGNTARSWLVVGTCFICILFPFHLYIFNQVLWIVSHKSASEERSRNVRSLVSFNFFRIECWQQRTILNKLNETIDRTFSRTFFTCLLRNGMIEIERCSKLIGRWHLSNLHIPFREENKYAVNKMYSHSKYFVLDEFHREIKF